MNTRALHAGDRIKANVKGRVFEDTLITRLQDGRWLVGDTKPRSTYLHLSSRQIVERLDLQERWEVAG